MTGSKLLVYPLCSSREALVDWRGRSGLYPDLDIRPLHPFQSAVAAAHELAATAERPFLLCREDVWLGVGLAAQAGLLMEELSGRFPNWALCANRGVRWDGRQVFDYTYDTQRGGLATAVCAHPALVVDDAVLLVNPAVLKSHGKRAPALNSGGGVLLSLECLENGSVAAVSPRLMAMREPGAEGGPAGLDGNAEFREYYRSRFLNHELATPDGPLSLAGIVDYRYLKPWERGAPRDVLDLYDRALAAAGRERRPTLTICCRTQFNRPELLERAVLSFAACGHSAGELADVRVRLITDQPAAVAEPAVSRLRETYPATELECWLHDVRPGRHSRTDLLLAAIERADTDYIWFVDDDDFVNAAAGRAVARCLPAAGAAFALIGSAVAVKERWESEEPAAGQGSPAPRLRLAHAERGSRYEGADLVRVLRGHNFIPICGMILPLELLRERVRNRAALGDYNEDYFLLLLALTAPRLETSILDVEIASVSIRGQENTVAQRDAAGWRLSFATFMLEILNNPEGNSPFLWRMGNLWRW